MSSPKGWWDARAGTCPPGFWKGPGAVETVEEVNQEEEEDEEADKAAVERELTPTKYRMPPVPDISFSFFEDAKETDIVNDEKSDDSEESFASTTEKGGADDEELDDRRPQSGVVSTFTFTLSLKEENLYEILPEKPEIAEATYASPRAIEEALASLAPVYSSVSKFRPRPPLPLPPPPLPEPDWDSSEPTPTPSTPSTPAITSSPPVANSNEVWKKKTKLDKAWNSLKKWWYASSSFVSSSPSTPTSPPPSRPTSPMPSTLVLWPSSQGQSGFEDLRRYIKQGGDFCKELASILHERSEAEAQYAKTLSKLSAKLVKSTREGVGTVNAAWQRIGTEMEAHSEIHRSFASCLSEEVVKPLRQLLESQHRIRKSVENAVDKSGKSLAEWRSAESKAKKNSFSCARENEKLRDGNFEPRSRLSASSLQLHRQSSSTEKEIAKLESKRRKAEECVKKADIEYYSVCMRSERARLEWESAVLRGSHCFQVLEEERLRGLKDLASSYLGGFKQIGPKLTEICGRVAEPVGEIDVAVDLETVQNLKAATQPSQEQLLPDFYAEHLTLAMNRERRKMALVKLMQLIRQDLERERRGKNGVENLARALKQSPNFATQDTQHNVSEKLHHMRSMLAYLEATRYKVSSALAEIEGRPKESHPLADHIHVTRDRQGYQHTTLKVPSWVHKDVMDVTDYVDWVERGTADGNSVQPDSDFDEFSSQGSEKEYEETTVIRVPESVPHKCKALYNYTANLYDELSLNPGDIINIHDKQPDGWWLGELNGVVGIFPATYVEEIK